MKEAHVCFILYHTQAKYTNDFKRFPIISYLDMWQCSITKTHVRGFFDTDLHEVSWHFATHEAVRPSGF